MKRLRSMLLLAAILAGAPTPGLSQQQPSPQQAPSATELFALRSACAQLGQKQLDKVNASIGPLPGETPLYDFSQKSRYDPITGHCYVEVDKTSINSLGLPLLPNDPSYQSFRWLYDGQTGEFLAVWYFQEGKADGDIYVGDSELQRQSGVTSCLRCASNTQDYINRTMSENR